MPRQPLKSATASTAESAGMPARIEERLTPREKAQKFRFVPHTSEIKKESPGQKFCDQNMN